MACRVTSRRAILVAAFAVFAIYAFPGFIGWDTEAHLLQSRAGVYTDAHPPIIPALWRVVELVLAGPLGMLLIQAGSLLAGLDRTFRRMLAPRAAAIAAACVFVFPPVAGVTALVIKDALMAGFLVLGTAALPDRPWRGLAWLAIASTMRWNALAATLPIIAVLLPVAGSRLRRLAIVAAAWLAITAASFAVNSALADRHVHAWYGTHAYMDIAGTLRWVDADDAQIADLLDGVPLAGRGEHLRARVDALYDPADYRLLAFGDDRIFEPPATDADREAIGRAWQRVVLGHPRAYLRYRWDNFRNLMRFDRPKSFAHVYVWFTVIAAPDSIDRLDHDASPSRVQDRMRSASVWLSNTPLYWPWIYLAVAVIGLVAWRREPIIAALLASGICYELAWFVLDPTGDFRYSQWLVLCTAIAVAWRIGKRYSKNTTRPSAQRAASQATIA